MAKYTINYACGHGSTEKELFGKHAERDRYIVWAETNMVCRDCYIDGRRKADAAASKSASLSVSGISGATITISVSGQIEANKDALRAIGFKWSDGLGGFMDFLSTKKPTARFCVDYHPTSIDDAQVWLNTMRKSLDGIGYPIEVAINPIDLEMMREAFARQQSAATAKAAAVAANPKPERPKWFDELMKAAGPGSTWNCKIYSNRRIYISNQEHRLTADQATELESYRKARLAHLEAMKVQP